MKQLFALVLLATLAQAQYNVIYSFNGTDGTEPRAELAADAQGNLYGTTSAGGAQDKGTVFKLSPDGLGGWQYSLLYTFTGGSDSDNPRATLFVDAQGNIYGTTLGDTQNCFPDCGSAFKIDNLGQFSTLHSFKRTDGWAITAGLIMGPDGTLYGAASSGGAKGGGNIFQIKDGVFKVIHSFGPNDLAGSYPTGTLSMDAQGNLYGVSNNGGLNNMGTVFRLKAGTWRASALHSFAGGSKGEMPIYGMTWDSLGNLYGVCTRGVFGNVWTEQLVNGKWLWKKLYGFKYHNPAQKPTGSVYVDPNGVIYGAAGVLYKLIPGKPYEEQMVQDVGDSIGGLIALNGKIYGTTVDGGQGFGTVYEVGIQ